MISVEKKNALTREEISDGENTQHPPHRSELRLPYQILYPIRQGLHDFRNAITEIPRYNTNAMSFTTIYGSIVGSRNIMAPSELEKIERKLNNPSFLFLCLEFWCAICEEDREKDEGKEGATTSVILVSISFNYQ